MKAKYKKFIINGIAHYRLHSVSGDIGLTYHEVYHNYDKWEKPLGLTRVRKHVYCISDRAKVFIRLTPGMVPLEYEKKRYPLVEKHGGTPDKARKIKIIYGSAWVTKSSPHEKKLDKKNSRNDIGTER